MAHRFRLGQCMRLRIPATARNAGRIYEIVTLLPEVVGGPGYRTHGTEAGTREAREQELTPATRTPNQPLEADQNPIPSWCSLRSWATRRLRWPTTTEPAMRAQSR